MSPETDTATTEVVNPDMTAEDIVDEINEIRGALGIEENRVQQRHSNTEEGSQKEADLHGQYRAYRDARQQLGDLLEYLYVESEGEKFHRVVLSDEDLAFIRSLLNEALSSSDIDRQDKALELQEELPEPGTLTSRRWS